MDDEQKELLSDIRDELRLIRVELQMATNVMPEADQELIVSDWRLGQYFSNEIKARCRNILRLVSRGAR